VIRPKEEWNASKKRGTMHEQRNTKSLLELLHDLRFVLKMLYYHNWY